MSSNEKINYLEYPAVDLEATKTFFTKTFNWEFTDYGPQYTAFENQSLDVGFYHADLASDADTGSALSIFFSDDLESSEKKVINNGGAIIKPIFSFPGGRRFHFTEPSGNEFAVWSDK